MTSEIRRIGDLQPQGEWIATTLGLRCVLYALEMFTLSRRFELLVALHYLQTICNQVLSFHSDLSKTDTWFSSLKCTVMYSTAHRVAMEICKQQGHMAGQELCSTLTPSTLWSPQG